MRGQKLSTEQIEKAKHLYAANGNIAETAREMGLNRSTLIPYLKKAEQTDEFKQLRQEKKEAFAEAADRIIAKGLKRLEEALDDTSRDISVNHLSTVIGTIYDKRALENGKATNSIEILVKLPDGAEEYAD